MRRQRRPKQRTKRKNKTQVIFTCLEAPMKANNANRSINNQSEIQTVKPAFRRITAKPKLAPYGTLLLPVGLLSANIASAFDFVPFVQGTLPSGKIVSMFQVTFAPVESFPWHLFPWPICRGIGTAPLT